MDLSLLYRDFHIPYFLWFANTLLCRSNRKVVHNYGVYLFIFKVNHHSGFLLPNNQLFRIFSVVSSSCAKQQIYLQLWKIFPLQYLISVSMSSSWRYPASVYFSVTSLLYLLQNPLISPRKIIKCILVLNNSFFVYLFYIIISILKVSIFLCIVVDTIREHFQGLYGMWGVRFGIISILSKSMEPKCEFTWHNYPIYQLINKK